MKFLALYCCFFISTVTPAFGQVRVAFIEGIRPDGSRVQLEPGATYYHLALQIADGRWHHSYPRIGSVLVRNLHPALGVVTQVLENYEMPLVTYKDIEPFLGQPFDPLYGFKSSTTSYCSKRVGQQLGIPPKPRMKFSSQMWDKVPGLKKNQKGWSPDYIFNYLMNEMNFKPVVPFGTYNRVNLAYLSHPLPSTPTLNPSLYSNLSCKQVLK